MKFVLRKINCSCFPYYAVSLLGGPCGGGGGGGGGLPHCRPPAPPPRQVSRRQEEKKLQTGEVKSTCWPCHTLGKRGARPNKDFPAFQSLKLLGFAAGRQNCMIEVSGEIKRPSCCTCKLNQLRGGDLSVTFCLLPYNHEGWHMKATESGISTLRRSSSSRFSLY